MIRYLTALITATLAGLAGVWLVLAPAALDYPGPGVYASVPARVSVFTGAGLCVLAVLTGVCWSAAWRRRLRSEGVLPGAPRDREPDGAVPSRPPGKVRRDAVRPRAAQPARPKPSRRLSPASDVAPSAAVRSEAARSGTAASGPNGRGPVTTDAPETAATGPLPAVPAAVPVRLEDRGLPALLAPRVAALTGDAESSSTGTSAGVASTATPFGDAAVAGRSRRRAGWRAWSLADDDAEETW